MATTLEELEKRVLALEQEVVSLRQLLERRPVSAGPPDSVPPMIREARALQPMIDAATEKAWAEMGITAEPVPVEKLRQMMIECGVKPEENSASREIIAMREE
jgi:hypothetical protein